VPFRVFRLRAPVPGLGLHFGSSSTDTQRCVLHPLTVPFPVFRLRTPVPGLGLHFGSSSTDTRHRVLHVRALYSYFVVPLIILHSFLVAVESPTELCKSKQSMLTNTHPFAEGILIFVDGEMNVCFTFFFV
jgi:hypothetical protein